MIERTESFNAALKESCGCGEIIIEVDGTPFKNLIKAEFKEQVGRAYTARQRDGE